MTVQESHGWDLRAPMGDSLRILMVAARYFPFMGGTEAHIHETGRRLAERGHSVSVLTTDPTGRLAACEAVAGMRVARVRAWPKNRDWCFAPQLYSHIAKRHWDVVHVQGYHTFVAPIAMLAAARNDIPFVLTFHSGGHSSKLRNSIRGMQCTALRPLVNRAARCLAVSDFEADLFSASLRLPRDRFTVVPNGAHVPAPARDTVPANGGCLIVSVGRLERYKGHHRAIAAMPHLLQRLPSARLCVLGEGPYEGPLRDQIQQLGLTEHVTISAIPAGDRQAMGTLLSGSSLVVLFSDYEAHPIAILEALSLQKPVVVTSTSGLKELADRGLARSVTLGASPVEIASVMAEEIGARRPAPTIALPSWEDCCTRLVEVYASVVSGTRPASQEHG